MTESIDPSAPDLAGSTPSKPPSPELVEAVIVQVDARGLACPLPLLKTKLALHGLEVGHYLRVLATDRGSVRDCQAFARLSPHSLVSVEEIDGVFAYLWKKGGNT